MVDSIKIKGKIQIFRNGVLEYEKNNMVVNTGLNLLADLVKGASSPLSHIEVGSGTTPVTEFDTTLETPILRKAVTDMDAVDNVLTVETQYEDYEANTTWGECGCFNAAVAGTMFNRINITFTKTAGDVVIVRFTFTFTRT